MTVARLLTLLLQETVTGMVEGWKLRCCARTAAQTAALRRLAQALRDALQSLPGGPLVHDPANMSLHRRVLTVAGLPLLPLLLAGLLGDGIEPGRLLPSPGLGSPPQLARSGQDGVTHIGQVQLFLLKRENVFSQNKPRTAQKSSG